MTLKNCSFCKKMLTTRTVKAIGRMDMGGVDMLYVNCLVCMSTAVVMSRDDMAKMRLERLITKIGGRNEVLSYSVLSWLSRSLSSAKRHLDAVLCRWTGRFL